MHIILALKALHKSVLFMYMLYYSVQRLFLFQNRPIKQWLSIFLMLRLLNKVPFVVVTTIHKMIPIPIKLLFHNYNFLTVINNNVSLWHVGYLICNPQRGHSPQVKNCCYEVFPAIFQCLGNWFQYFYFLK